MRSPSRKKATPKKATTRTKRLFRGHKGPWVGVLKTSRPRRRDGDRDSVVTERRPRKTRYYAKSPARRPRRR